MTRRSANRQMGVSGQRSTVSVKATRSGERQQERRCLRMVELLGFSSDLMLKERRRNFLLVDDAEEEIELVVERLSGPGLGWISP